MGAILSGDIREAADNRRSGRASEALRDSARSPNSAWKCCGSTARLRNAQRRRFRRASETPHKPGSLLRYSAAATARFWESSGPPWPVGDGCVPSPQHHARREGSVQRVRPKRAQTDATFVANNLSPERMQASFSYKRTDAARFAGLDASLRLALSGGLQEKLDQQAINGSGRIVERARICQTTTSTTTYDVSSYT